MASFTFDVFGQFEKPFFILCNPDKTELYSLGNAVQPKLILKFNALWEFSFTLTQTIQNSNGDDITDPAYSFLKAKRLVLIENYGYFQITNVDEDLDGLSPIKSVTCMSLEYELSSKQVNGFTTDSIKFYDPDDNTGTFTDLILAGTGWTIQDVSPSLWNIYRAIDIPSSSVYNSLMVTAEQAFNCIFSFDTDSKSVSVTGVDDSTYNTDVFISFNNLIKQAKFKEITEEIVTVMSVYGGGDLDIRAVNPLGTDKIYNFSYYTTLEWMTQDLINAVTNWNNKINNNQVNYSNLLTQLRNQYDQLSVLQATLSTQNDELAALIEVKKVQVQGSQSLTSINSQIAAKNAQITTTTTSITNKNTQIANTNTQIVAINNNLALTNTANFTTPQLEVLKRYMYENVYKNENIIVTSIMSNSEIQAQAQELYNTAKGTPTNNYLDGILSKVSQPRYEFSMDCINLFALQEFQSFGNALNLGALVTIELKEGEFIYTGLLEIDLNFDQLNDFQMVFSNRLRLDNGSYIYSDMAIDTRNTGISVDYNSTSWGQYPLDKPNILNTTSILNATKNQIVNNSNSQEITINQHGIIGRQETTPGSGIFTGNQIWVTSNSIAFSKDSFSSAGLALGQIVWNNQTVFGIVGDAIIGRILAGNALTITNSGGNFTLDSAGARLVDATFTITASSAHPNEIILSPTSGISIKNKTGLTVFSADGAGNITIKAALNAATGSFSGDVKMLSGTVGTATQGLIVNSTGLKTLDGVNFLSGNGDLHWGALTISGSTATFSGSVFASSLNGQINGGSQIQANTITSSRIHDLNADSIVTGILNGIQVYGCAVGFGGTFNDPNVVMSGLDDVGLFRATTGVQIYLGTQTPLAVYSALFLDGDGTNFGASLYVNGLQNTPSGTNGTVFLGIGLNKIKMRGASLDLTSVASVITPSGTAINGVFKVNMDNLGTRTWTISRGIIVSIN